MSQCPVCHTEGDDVQILNTYPLSVLCEQCGQYKFSDLSHDDRELTSLNDEKRILLSFYIRQANIGRSYPEWDLDMVDKIIKERSLPKPHEQVDLVILWLGNSSKHIGHVIEYKEATIIGVGGFLNSASYRALLYEMQASDYIIESGATSIDVMSVNPIAGRISLTLKGWKKFEDVFHASENSNNAFMAMKFDDDQLDDLLNEHIKPAVSETGYKLFKLNDRPEAGLIDIRMRQEIKNSKFLIADLTHQNAGAYWEAGFAEGLGKKVIYLCNRSIFDNEETKPHFDVNHHLTILWDENNPQPAMEELKAAIRYTFPEAKQQDTIN